MKQADFQPCAICNRGMMHAGLPLFYSVTVTRHGIKADAVRRQQGLEMMLGAAAPLGAILGPNEVMTEILDGPKRILICETCTHDHPILMQAFLGSDE